MNLTYKKLLPLAFCSAFGVLLPIITAAGDAATPLI